jgi:transcriptional regulator with XRE-family HTH domain
VLYNDFQMTGKEIRKIRVGRGWTQANLATRLGFCENTLQKIEAEKRDPSHKFMVKMTAWIAQTSPKDKAM